MDIDASLIEWSGFLSELEQRSQRLISEIEGAWKEVDNLLHEVEDAHVRHSRAKLDVTSFDGVATSCGQPIQDLCFGPIGRYKERRPILRALRAIQDYESSLDELTRLVPESVNVSGIEFANRTGIKRPGQAFDHFFVWQKVPHSLPLHRIVADFLFEDALRRASIDGKFQRSINRACVEVGTPWKMFVARIFPAVGVDAALPAGKLEWESWASAISKLRASVNENLLDYCKWSERQAPTLVQTIAREGRYTNAGRNWNREQRHRNAAFWARQQRATASLVDLFAEWQSTISATARAAQTQGQELREEYAALQATAASLLSELRSLTPEQPLKLPRLERPVLDLDQRLAQWRDTVLAESARWLPERVEMNSPASRPALWRRWRKLNPQALFQDSVHHVGVPALRSAVEPWTTLNLSLVRDAVRVVETVDYGRESLRPGQPSSENLFQEAVGNAIGLLDSRTTSSTEAHAALDAGLVRAVAATIADASLSFAFHGTGLGARVSKRRGLQLLAGLRQRAARSTRTVSRHAVARIRELDHAVLEYLGLRLPDRPAVEPVVRRSDLSQVMAVRLTRTHLPAIYRHLFSLAPVEDPRFLVGRDEELAGLSQALEHWDAGEFSALLMVGARGSGKTSLLNCALSTSLKDRQVLRSEFCTRLHTASQMDDFLERLMNGDKTSGRRVIVLEEFERTYLRSVGGFEALQRLLHVVHATAKDIFWVFSINDNSMGYLEFALRLGSYFPFRINAMSIRPADLRNAILQRHNLSGLRLRFAAPPVGDPRIGRVGRWLGFGPDPETLFFESLYQQSQGVFRSAFELWQGSIEQVDGGFVEMRQPLAPDYSRLRDALVQDDHFTLTAIMQHGSLLPDELSKILLEPQSQSELRLRRLETMELLEPDPRFPGARVRPGASRFVRETLHRVNLL